MKHAMLAAAEGTCDSFPRRETAVPETGAGGSGAGMEQQESEAAAPSLTAPLATAPLEIAGDWAESAPADGARVAERLRQAALAGVALVSDRQPARLKIECRL